MSILYRYITGGILVAILLASPGSVAAQSSDQAQLALLRQLVALLQTQLAELLAQSATPQRTQTQYEPYNTSVPERTINLGKYSNTARSVSQIPDERAKFFFERVRELTPSKYLPLIEQFEVRDFRGSPDAQVFGHYRSDNGFVWHFYIDREYLANGFSQAGMDELIVHEVAHIIGDTDGTPFEVRSRCHDYLANNIGCPRLDSLYMKFVAEFWSEKQLDEMQRRNSITEQNYARTPGSFVSRYASRNPKEDFAESFAQFVLDDRNSHRGVAGEKVDFFDRYSMSRSLKEEILTDL